MRDVLITFAFFTDTKYLPLVSPPLSISMFT